ncbi:hypothetical protein [Halomicrococcus sp. NG-SE-24]|uniref:hypothetical protein n=1 Tax=Halomicrococcus sp. NG-SE-24 TaxID=3436928 RepID=UPI003D98A16C
MVRSNQQDPVDGENATATGALTLSGERNAASIGVQSRDTAADIGRQTSPATGTPDRSSGEVPATGRRASRARPGDARGDAFGDDAANAYQIRQ